MTGSELRAYRESRKLTREAFAHELGNSSSTVNKWERGINPVPEWVVDKVWRHFPITLPVEDLAIMLEVSRAHLEQILSAAIRQWLAHHRPKTISYHDSLRHNNTIPIAAETPPAEKKK